MPLWMPIPWTLVPNPQTLTTRRTIIIACFPENYALLGHCRDPQLRRDHQVMPGALAGEDCEIVVVDNASADDTVQRIEEFVAWNPVRLIANEENLGFGAAVNQGAREATEDVLLMLNPDAIAEPGAVAALLRCLETTQAGAVGGALLESDGQPARGFAFRRIPTLAELLYEVLLVNQLRPGNPVNRRYRCLDADYSQQQEVEQPAGACLAITRTAWDSLRGFDEQFFPSGLKMSIYASGCSITV